MNRREQKASQLTGYYGPSHESEELDQAHPANCVRKIHQRVIDVIQHIDETSAEESEPARNRYEISHHSLLCPLTLGYGTLLLFVAIACHTHSNSKDDNTDDAKFPELSTPQIPDDR